MLQSKNSSLLLSFSKKRATVTKIHSIFATTTATDIINQSKNYQQIRCFAKRGRKGAAMGHHLKNLNETAHEKFRQNNKKKNKLDDSLDDQTQKVTTDLEDVESYENLEEEEEDENDEFSLLPDPNEMKKKMERIVQNMENNFRSIRGAEPTPEIFENIPVNAYGSSVPLNTIAQIVVQSSSQVILTCYDPSTSSAVLEAVRDKSSLGFNPKLEEGGTGNVIVPIPKVSAETRLNLVKQLKKTAEGYRLKLRNIRRKANDKVKLGKDGKLEGVSKDEAFRVAGDIDKITDEFIKQINETLQTKEESIMKV